MSAAASALTTQTVLLTAIGAALGGVARLLVSVHVTNALPGFPWGTLLINVSGCLAIGLLYGWTEQPGMRALLGVGVLGGYTTFSTFGWETLLLIQNNRLRDASLYVAASLLVGLALTWAGWGIAQLMRR